MPNFFTFENGNSMLIYPHETQILMHRKRGSQIGYPAAVATDYKKDFDAISYRGTIYYLYCNDEDHYVIKSILSTESLYLLPFSGEILTSRIHMIGAELVLFYVEKYTDCTQTPAYQLSFVCPFSSRIPPQAIISLPAPLLFYCYPLEKGLFVFVKGQTEIRFYVIGSDFSVQSLHPDQEVAALYAAIESAKTQYNELMEVAGKYRDEAIKWRGKYYKE